MKQGCIAGLNHDTSGTHWGRAFLYYSLELAYEIFRWRVQRAAIASDIHFQESWAYAYTITLEELIKELRDEKRRRLVNEPYRYSVMNTMWIRSKAPN